MERATTLPPEARFWWLVKTTMTADGRLDAELFRDLLTKQAVMVRSDRKPLDESYEDRAGNAVYYTYHESYDEAATMIEQVGSHADPYSEPFIIDTQALAASMMGAAGCF
jgi:hypothetical protein